MPNWPTLQVFVVSSKPTAANSAFVVAASLAGDSEFTFETQSPVTVRGFFFFNESPLDRVSQKASV
jgi:hypothetical protein